MDHRPDTPDGNVAAAGDRGAVGACTPEPGARDVTAGEDLERSPAEDAVRALLAAQPDPGPMPAAVERRVVTALGGAATVRAADQELYDELGMVQVAEPEGASAGEPDAAPQPGGPLGALSHLRRLGKDGPLGRNLRPHGSDGEQPEDADEAEAVVRRRWPVLAAAAGVVAVGLLGALGVSQLRSTPDGLAALPGGGASGGAVTAAIHVQATGTAYTQESLASGARVMLTAPAAEAGPADTADAGSLSTPAGVKSCVAALGGADALAVSVDVATFEGQPAAVVAITRGDQTTAYAVSRECTAGAPHLLHDPVAVP